MKQNTEKATKSILTSVISKSQNEKRIIINEKGSSHFIPLDIVTHLESDSYLTTLHLEDGTSHTVAKLLKEFDEVLSPYGFIRIQRNLLINSAHLKTCNNKGNRNIILLDNDFSISISRRGMYRVKERMLDKIV